MENENRNKLNNYIVYSDILSIFRLATEIGWDELRVSSVFRVLYLGSVLYSFRYPEKNNPFGNYRFSLHQNGPYDSIIDSALTFLVKDDYLGRVTGEDILALGDNQNDEFYKLEVNSERYIWLKQVVYILGVYGEGKIYDFIFRDPEYQTTIMSNTNQGLDTSKDNETVKTLQAFQQAFEETLPDKNISSQTYLELYFEYIFSKILKREE